MSYLSNKNEHHDNFNSIDQSSLNKQGPFRLDLSFIRSYEDEQLGLNWLSPTINQFPKNYYNLDNISWQKNKDCHLSSETPTIGLIREYLFNNKEVIGITSEHVSNMCDKMKVMFMQSQNPGSDAVTDVAKILLPEQWKNTETIKFLKGRGLEYMAQHRSCFNSDLSFYAEALIQYQVRMRYQISLYITNDFFKDILFTQLAIIKQEELFETLTIINPLKKFLKEAFLLHLKYEITHSNNPNMDNYYTLQQVKELDHLTNGLIIPSLTHKNTSNQINMSRTIRKHHTRRIHR
ncbi:unnamed protein product [Rhizophagus irregularis]|nr:unnamed protein product [Rhizophagus irregularis]